MSNQTLPLLVGHDKDGKDISFDLATLPHLLIGGCTGSGKSVCIKSILLLADMLALGRSAGVHFIFATSRADEVVMSQPLRCGFPGRIAFKVAFEEDSRIIIGENGADRLNGRGDFLFRDATGLHCGQAPYIPDEDFERLCTH